MVLVFQAFRRIDKKQFVIQNIQLYIILNFFRCD
jgi:hypothetical protein